MSDPNQTAPQGFWSLFKSPAGDVSSKRVGAFVCLAVAIVLVFVSKDFKPDPVALGGFLGAFTALLGASAITHT